MSASPEPAEEADKDKETILGSKPTSEMGEEETGETSKTFDEQMRKLPDEWEKSLRIAAKEQEKRESLGLDIVPDPGELPAGVTRRKKKVRLSEWQKELEIEEELEKAETIRKYRSIIEKQEARKKYASPTHSFEGEWGEEEEEEEPRKAGQRGPGGKAAHESDEEEREHRSRSSRPPSREGGRRGRREVGSHESDGEEREHELRSPSPSWRDGGRRDRRDRTPPRRRKRPKIPPIPAKFDGDSKGLGLFLTRVTNHMLDWGEEYESDAARVRHVTTVMEGRAAAWFVSLQNKDSPLMRNYKHFMTALKKNFEDPMAEERAKNRLKTMRQGRRSVSQYTQEFNDLLPCMKGWSEISLVDIYKEGLDRELYKLCRLRASPRSLEGWMALAAEMEIEMDRDRLWESQTWKRGPVRSDERRARRPSAAEGGARRTLVCFRCGKDGHRAANCRTQLPPEQPLSRKKGVVKQSDKPREAAKAGADSQQTTPTTREEEAGKPNTSDDDNSTSDSDEDLLVSWKKGPLTIPIKLVAPSSGNTGEIMALLDTGCTRCLISPEVVEKMELKLKTLRKPIAFCQLDGSVAGGGPAHFATEPLEMVITDHRETLNFIVAPGMDQPIVLGLTWFRKWNPSINWRTGVLRFRTKPQGLRNKITAKESSAYADTLGAITESIEGEEKIPKEYWDLKEVFSEKASDVLPPHRSTDCAIEILPGEKLPKPKAYPMTQKELGELKTFITKNLERGFIQSARPRVAAPVMFREKKDGTFRLIVDYRNLNAICVENVYPMPLMKDMLTHLSKGKFFTKLDLREAYYRVRIKEGDEWKTAFNCPLGCFQFRVLPFGLQGAPAVFMQLINEVLQEHLFNGVLVYLNDILIYTETMEEHVELVRAVLKKLLAAELYAKLSKCEFHQTKIDYLGYRISAEGLEMDPEKVRAVQEWAPPRTRKQLQSFLGFANFYRQFIPAFADIALPITNLLKTKGDKKPKPSLPLKWTMECQAAFEKLKRLFSAEPILKHPDMDIPFVVQADASDVAIGAVLLQPNADGNLQPCAYTSRKLTETEKGWAIWEKEAFAVHWALTTWRHFLEGANHPFEVWTDHKNLEALKTPRKLSPKQARWAQYFKRFNFSLKFLPGGKNFLADALSRLPQYNTTPTLKAAPILPVQQLAAPAITRAQAKRESPLPNDLKELLTKSLDSDDWFLAHAHDCTRRDGLAWMGAKIYVPSSMRATILKLCHDTKSAGHFGFVKTLHLLKRQFWWPGLKKDVNSYIASCPVCAAAKRPPGKPPGLLQTVARPESPWKEISMDFIVELPESGGNTVIWVVTDLFSKQVHFIPCSKIPSAKTLAKLFIQHIYRLHGVPSRIISDRGVQFTSNFWKEFLHLLGSSQGLSSAHHPQTNGACERTNAVLEQYLRCYINYQQDNWADLLPFAEVAYNNSVHSSTGYTPFKIASGQEFVPIPELPTETPTIPSLADWIEQLQSTWKITRKAIDDAHNAHKQHADKKRAPEIKYQVGDKVFLSTKYLQTTQKSKKLGPKYVGPFPIVKVINPVTFQLDLPKNLKRIHPVFHVSLLKPEHTSNLRPTPIPPPLPILIGGEEHFEVDKILDSRKHRNKIQYLVVWKHFPVSQAEWVNKEDMRADKKIAQFHAKYPNKP